MKRFKFIIGSTVIALGLAYLFASGLSQSTSTHMTLRDLAKQVVATDLEGKRIQLGGCKVVPGSIRWDEYRHRPAFTVADSTYSLEIRYVGNAVLPDTFKDEAQVVLEGYYDSGRNYFEAQIVFAKCPSKYEGQSYEGHVQAMNADI